MAAADWPVDDVLYADKQLVIGRTSAPAGLTVSGAIDVFNVDAFSQALVDFLQDEGDTSVDLRYLEFCDLSGIRALASVAEQMGAGRRLVLIGLPQQLQYVLKLVGWNDLPGLVIGHPGEL